MHYLTWKWKCIYLLSRSVSCIVKTNLRLFYWAFFCWTYISGCVFNVWKAVSESLPRLWCSVVLLSSIGYLQLMLSTCFLFFDFRFFTSTLRLLLMGSLTLSQRFINSIFVKNASIIFKCSCNMNGLIPSRKIIMTTDFVVLYYSLNIIMYLL